ncbi:MAG TPA: ABC transporter ATP-binding protein [Acidimicrobiales bacterium]|nr:ABC transporter ATP-binding protein [Acidimicrobiales bacterium]
MTAPAPITTPPPTAPAALEFRNVSASYSNYRALFDVSFSVPEGSVVALLGANGAGKSTVARVATGLVAATGCVLVGGRDVTRLSAHRIARMGVAHVPEGRGVFGDLNVEENLVLSLRRHVPGGQLSSALDYAYSVLPALAARRHQAAGTLSGGEQRMLSLAGVLASSPRLVIADELSLGLAPVVVDAVYEGLKAIHRRGAALLVVEQQVDRALSLADHAVLLSRGAVHWQGTPVQARAEMELLLMAGYAPPN